MASLSGIFYNRISGHQRPKGVDDNEGVGVIGCSVHDEQYGADQINDVIGRAEVVQLIERRSHEGK